MLSWHRSLGGQGMSVGPRSELQRGRWDTGAASQPRGWCGRCGQEGQRGKGRAKRFGETRRVRGAPEGQRTGCAGGAGPRPSFQSFLQSHSYSRFLWE